MSKLYFIVGSQDLYGEECLKQVAADAKEMVDFLGEKLKDTVEIELLPTVETSELCVKDIRTAENDDDCVGVITWMHTFSPAKMWIKGLQILRKPLLHLHTQYNEKLPYDSIDMDFMNLNQAAHGDREYGFILATMWWKKSAALPRWQRPSTFPTTHASRPLATTCATWP